MYFKIYIRKWLKQPELVCLKKFESFDQAKVYKIALEQSMSLPKGYYIEIQGFYE